MKRLLLTLFFMLIMSDVNFAYTESNFDHTYNWGIYARHTQNFTFDKNFYLTDKKVSMTQDEKNYYFEVGAIANLNDDLKGKFISQNMDFGTIPNTLGIRNSLLSDRFSPILYRQANFTDKGITRYYYFQCNNGGELYTFNQNLYFGPTKVSTFYYDRNMKNRNYVYTYDRFEDYFYMDYPMSGYDFSSERGNQYNPNTGKYDIAVYNAQVMLGTQDGFSLNSRYCNINNYSVNSSNYITELKYNVGATFTIRKDVVDKYRYVAFGGLTILTYGLYCNDYVSTYKGIFSSTDTMDLGEYTNCEHKWKYSFEPHINTHEKICEKCKWKKLENHDFQYEYDGIKNNLCSCGYKQKVKYHYEINDDYTGIVDDVVNTYENYTAKQFKEKKGYEFLYYEKYQNVYDDENSPIYATSSTCLKKKKIANVATISDITENYSTSYVAVYKPLRFIVSFVTPYGKFSNGSNSITKSTTYQDFNDFETIYSKPTDGSYFDYWDYNGVKIRNVNELKEYIKNQNMNITLSACFNKNANGDAENTAEKEYPDGKGGFYRKNVIDDDGKKVVENITPENALINYFINNPEKMKDYGFEKIEDVSIYDMSNSELNKLLLSMGIDVATISSVSSDYKYRFIGNGILTKILKFIVKYRFIFIRLGIILIMIYFSYIIIKKRNGKK